MTTERMEIRRAAVDVLKAALPELNERIYPNRTVSYEDWELPAITVFTTGETVTVEEQGPRRYLRKVNLVVQIATREIYVVDDVLDALAEKAEQAIEASDDLNQSAGRVELTSVQGPTVEADGRQPVGFVELVYEAWYRYAPPRALTSDLNPLREVAIEIDSAPRTGPEIEGRALPEQE